MFGVENADDAVQRHLPVIAVGGPEQEERNAGQAEVSPQVGQTPDREILAARTRLQDDGTGSVSSKDISRYKYSESRFFNVAFSGDNLAISVRQIFPHYIEIESWLHIIIYLGWLFEI